MGIPTHVAFGASANRAGTGTLAVSQPAGLLIGDIEILVVATGTNNNGVATTATVTDNGGGAWTAIASYDSDQTDVEGYHVWWRRYDSGDSNPTVTIGGDGDHAIAGMGAYRGCVATGDPIHLSESGSELTSDTTFSWQPTNRTTTLDDCLGICIATETNDTTSGMIYSWANASLSSVTERVEYCTNSGNGGGFSFCTGGKATAGDCGTWSATYAIANKKTYVWFALASLAAASDNAAFFTSEF